MLHIDSTQLQAAMSDEILVRERKRQVILVGIRWVTS